LGAISDVVVEIVVPNHFSAEDCADNVVRVSINDSNHIFRVSSIGSHVTVVVALKLRHRKHGFNLFLNGTALYKNATTHGKESSLPSWQIPIGITDFLRPAQLNTEVFGKQWGVHAQEKKLRLTPVSPFTSSALLETLCKELSLQLVQHIGNEGIVAGSLLNDELCLIHVYVINQAVDIIVHTKDRSLTEVVVRQLHKTIR
jgi:hypothetical protein